MNKDIVNTIIAGLGTVLTYLIGGWDSIIQILAILMVADYITGISKGYKNKELASSVGFKGLLKKSAIFIVIILAHQLDLVVNADVPIFRTMCVYFYIANEGISITENLAVLGVPLPKFLTDVLNKIKSENNEVVK